MNPNVQEFAPARSTVTALRLAGSLVRKKPQEFDGKYFWEAHRDQFELLAARNVWNDQKCAVQLATSLKGTAVRRKVDTTGGTGARGRYWTQHQNEVFRAKFETRTRRRGESLQELAQDFESMALEPTRTC